MPQIEDAAQDVQPVLAAIRELLARGDDDELSRRRESVQSGLVAAAAAEPDESVRLMAQVGWRCDIDDRVARDVLAHWLRRPDAATFAATWGPVTGLLTQSADLCAWLVGAVPTAPAEFRQPAMEHLTGLLDEQFDKYQFSGASSPVWRVAYALGPATRAEWFCLLGDRAAERGDDTAAADRYQAADRFGGKGIPERLERLHDLAAHRLLRAGVTAPAKLKGTGTPSSYRQLLMAAAAVLRGEPAEAPIRELDRVDDERWRASTRLVNALDLLQRGDPESARRHLGPVVDSPADHDLAINARLVIGALDGDDGKITDAARELHARHGAGWPARSLVAPTTVLMAVSRNDPELLPELIDDTSAELDALRIAATGLVLARAAEALLHGEPEQTRRLITQAGGLLAGAEHTEADQLRRTTDRIAAIASELAGDSAPNRPLDRLAHAALHRDGEIHPATPEALRLWRELDDTSTGDHRSLHHLAIAEHAVAHRLEIDADGDAADHWRRALRCWARLVALPEFWDDLRAHLADVGPDASADDVAAAVATARAELPAQVLEPHVTRVLGLRRAEPERARTHMELIRTAPFDADVITAVRTRLEREAGSGVRRLLREGSIDRALDEARAWIEVDAEDVPLAELLLDVGMEHVAEARARGAGWAKATRPTLERIAEAVEPIRVTLELSGPELTARGRAPATTGDRAALAGKLARFAFWLGVSQLHSTYANYQANPFADRSGFRSARYHLNVAIILGLPAISPFDRAREFLVDAGKCASMDGHAMGFF